MDRETLMEDLDLILERSRGDELPGEWDWEPPLGTSAVAISASEPGDAALAGPDDEAVTRRTTTPTAKRKRTTNLP